ncbi:MAG: polyprenyl synthetase [Comamonadaceae bacterium 32-67-11]|nr:MAG: polyprenyl synthetase [Comamonadaceae bacterium 32-67-11]OZA90348.1 MAG: polyprenyl synthetase [Burkholderiales bacterium 34-67-9]
MQTPMQSALQTPNPAPTTAPAPDFSAWSAARLAEVERALDAALAPQAPAALGLAMRYAVLDGGKRLRPLLVWAAAEAAAGAPAAALASATHTAVLRAACAVELIHAYSLVHDDLPCMDNDVLRRGKPTVHVQYGEATALLAGDALQVLAFELLLEQPDAALGAALALQLARAAGHLGMAGGQAIDLASVGRRLSLAELEDMHRRKTGALLLASVQMGALAGGADAAALAALTRYGQALGLAFQVIDDVLDVVADSGILGKTAGKDAAADKPTFVSLMGLNGARQYAHDLLAQAHAALHERPVAAAQTLHDLADWVLHRSH